MQLLFRRMICRWSQCDVQGPIEVCAWFCRGPIQLAYIHLLMHQRSIWWTEYITTHHLSVCWSFTRSVFLSHMTILIQLHSHINNFRRPYFSDVAFDVVVALHMVVVMDCICPFNDNLWSSIYHWSQSFCMYK